MSTHFVVRFAIQGARHNCPEFGPDQEEPISPCEEPEEPSDLDDFDLPYTDDDSRWDAFIPDDDERDPLPEYGDFWTAQD